MCIQFLQKRERGEQIRAEKHVEWEIKNAKWQSLKKFFAENKYDSIWIIYVCEGETKMITFCAASHI